MDDGHHNEERLKFLLIDDATRNSLREVWPVLAPSIPMVLEKFYAHITAVPELSAKFGGPDRISFAKKAQNSHWESVFAARFDHDYIEKVRRVGKVHERIGLEPRWYIGGYAMVMNMLVDVVIKHFRKKPDLAAKYIKAMNQAIYLDMDYAVSIYIDEGKATFARKLDAMAKEFEGSVKSVAGEVAASTVRMRDSAELVSTAATDTSHRATAVAAASTQASSNVQTVAAASEELSASIEEIGRSVAESTRITQLAVGEATTASETIKRLVTNAGEISQVVKLINTIAAQTRLLALNATIEASHAGDAGKGFAVVAAEVKALSAQTATATDSIAKQVAAIQKATGEAAKAMGEIQGTISRVNEITNTIAAAVTEQSAATQEIARNVQEASTGVGEVSMHISSVTGTADRTGEVASSMLSEIVGMVQQSGHLQRTVDAFLGGLQAR